MRIVYYTLPALMDVALPFITEVSRLAELHVLLEVHPNSWQTSLFDIPPQRVEPGIVSAAPVLNAFPSAMRSCWQSVASFKLAAYRGSSSFHPASWGGSLQVARYILSLKPDIVHLEGATGRIIWALPFVRHKPILLTIHDPEPHSGENPMRKRVVRRLTFSLARRFILHNRTQVPLFTKNYGVPADRIDVIPMGMNYLFRNWIDKPLSDDGKTILFFGRLSPYKGLEVLYEAAPLVCKQIPDLRIVVAGAPVFGYQPPPPPALSNGGRVEILESYITNSQLAELFQQASLVVCPYTNATQSAVVLTAYSFYKPVVASRVGGLPEYISDGETGLLVEPGSSQALAQALIDLLRRLSCEPDLRQAFANHIINKCQTDLSWETIAQQTIQTYERALRR